MVLRGWEGWGVLSGVLSFGCVTGSLPVADVISRRFSVVPLMVGAGGVFGWVGLLCDRVCGLGREFGPFAAVGEGPVILLVFGFSLIEYISFMFYVGYIGKRGVYRMRGVLLMTISLLFSTHV
jgi:hypothetical protein